MTKLISRVTIIGVGVNKYKDNYLPDLRGTQKDLEKLKNTLTKDKKTAVFSPKQFIDLRNPTSSEFRDKINDYVLGRSAEGDILILYFSGHGVAVGRDDFGFCTTDTIIHPKSKIALPLSVVKLSEVLASLNTANIIPVVIIDACYSGVAGKQLKIPSFEAISTIQDKIHTVAASSYALLCSCSELDISVDTSDGGIFSNYLAEILTEGIEKDKDDPSIITLHDIFNELSERVLSINAELSPRLYIGTTLPKFPLAINPKHKLRKLTISPVYISILAALWKNGSPQTLTPDQILNLCGQGAYGNHNKLSLEPWDLVETVPGTKLRRLTDKGEKFMQGDFTIPKSIRKDPKTDKWVDVRKTKYVSYKDFQKANS